MNTGSLKETLRRHREDLVANGSVHWREERGNYALRWREKGPEGCVTHRSLTLGEDSEVAGRVRDILARWRSESPKALGPDQEELLQQARETVKDMRLSRGQKREFGRRLRVLLRTGQARAALRVLRKARRTPRRREGRPLQSGLW